MSEVGEWEELQLRIAHLERINERQRIELKDAINQANNVPRLQVENTELRQTNRALLEQLDNANGEVARLESANKILLESSTRDKNEITNWINVNRGMLGVLFNAKERIAQLEAVNQRLNEERYGLRWDNPDNAPWRAYGLAEKCFYVIYPDDDEDYKTFYSVGYAKGNSCIETIGDRATLADAQELARAHYESIIDHNADALPTVNQAINPAESD